MKQYKLESRRARKLVRASLKLQQTLWILEKGEVDQLDRNKEPVLYGFADLGFLNSGFKTVLSHFQDWELSLHSNF